MKRLFFLALLVAMFVSVSAQSSEEAKLWSRVEALSKAVFETKDSTILKDIVHKKVTYGHSAGNLEDKTEMIQKAAASKTTYKNKEIEKISVDIDGNTALVRHTFRATSVENGTENPLNLGILQVWKKENGKWYLWARQAVRIPPKS